MQLNLVSAVVAADSFADSFADADDALTNIGLNHLQFVPDKMTLVYNTMCV